MTKHFIPRNDSFTCEHCGKKVKPIVYGGSYRNHCHSCLWSKHVDTVIPGDRKSSCRGMMEPIGVFTRRTGEYVLVHHCLKCGFERFNRIAGDDNFKLVTDLSTIPVRTSVAEVRTHILRHKHVIPAKAGIYIDSASSAE